MDEQNGFIKISRQMLTWEWKDCPEMVALWIHILLTVNWKPSTWHGIEVKAGQRIASVRKLSAETGLSERQIRTCMQRLKSTQEIVIETTHGVSVINVINWAKFQCLDDASDTQTTHEATHERHRSDTPSIEEGKEREEYKRLKDKRLKDSVHTSCTPPTTKRFVKPTISEVADYCVERNNTVDAKRFVDYYEANGWMVGRNHMKDWRAAVRNWERTQRAKPNTVRTQAQIQRDVEIDELLKGHDPLKER